jgi:hypothetical protein
MKGRKPKIKVEGVILVIERCKTALWINLYRKTFCKYDAVMFSCFKNTVFCDIVNLTIQFVFRMSIYRIR